MNFYVPILKVDGTTRIDVYQDKASAIAEATKEAKKQAAPVVIGIDAIVVEFNQVSIKDFKQA